MICRSLYLAHITLNFIQLRTTLCTLPVFFLFVCVCAAPNSNAVLTFSYAIFERPWPSSLTEGSFYICLQYFSHARNCVDHVGLHSAARRAPRLNLTLYSLDDLVCVTLSAMFIFTSSLLRPAHIIITLPLGIDSIREIILEFLFETSL